MRPKLCAALLKATCCYHLLAKPADVLSVLPSAHLPSYNTSIAQVATGSDILSDDLQMLLGAVISQMLPKLMLSFMTRPSSLTPPRRLASSSLSKLLVYITDGLLILSLQRPTARNSFADLQRDQPEESVSVSFKSVRFSAPPEGVRRASPITEDLASAIGLVPVFNVYKKPPAMLAGKRNLARAAWLEAINCPTPIITGNSTAGELHSSGRGNSEGRAHEAELAVAQAVLHEPVCAGKPQFSRN